MKKRLRTPKPYHHGDLRQTLLDAVGEVLRERGIEGLSMRECARRAGVSWSAPIHHFGDRTGMLTAFAVQGFERLKAAMDKGLRTEHEPSRVAAAIGIAYVEFALAHPQHFRVMFRTELLNPNAAAYAEAHQATYRLLQESFKAYDMSLGMRKVIALDHRCLLAWTTVHGYASLCLEGSIKLPDGKGTLLVRRMTMARNLIALLGPSLFGPEADPLCASEQ